MISTMNWTRRGRRRIFVRDSEGCVRPFHLPTALVGQIGRNAERDPNRAQRHDLEVGTTSSRQFLTNDGKKLYGLLATHESTHVDDILVTAEVNLRYKMEKALSEVFPIDWHMGRRKRWLRTPWSFSQTKRD